MTVPSRASAAVLPDEVRTRLIELLIAEASQPHRSESDGQMAEGHRLSDLVAAIKAVPTLTPARGGAWGRIRMARAVPPGSDPR